MNIYHGVPSPDKLERARRLAPSYEHGAEYPPYRMSRSHDARWILDNGAYTSAFDLSEWVGALERAGEYAGGPDWVVLPDVYQEGMRSLVRSARFAGLADAYGYDHYLPVQDGMRNVEQTVRAAVDLGASGVFIGGSDGFKTEYAGQYIMTAHDYGLRAHIGKPGDRLTWADDLGADSVDTTSIVRNGYWHRLRTLEASSSTEQSTLAADGGTSGNAPSRSDS
jgi:hypothetical protein